MQILAELETRFGRRLPPESLADRLTPAWIAQAMNLEGAADEASHLAFLQPLGEHPALFCVPGIEATPLTFQFIARHLVPDHRVMALQGGWAGIDGAAGRDIETLAERHMATIRAQQPAGPYWICGYSIGARIAFAIARRLRAGGCQVGGLIILDGPLPGGPAGWRRAAPLAAGFLRNMPNWVRDDLLPGGARQFYRNVTRHARRLVGAGRQPAVARILDPARLTSGELEVREARYHATRRFHVGPYPGRIHVIRARTRPLLRPLDDASLGWARVAGGGVRVHEIAGNHMTMMSRAQAPAMAAILRNILADPEA